MGIDDLTRLDVLFNYIELKNLSKVVLQGILSVGEEIYDILHRIIHFDLCYSFKSDSSQKLSINVIDINLQKAAHNVHKKELFM